MAIRYNGTQITHEYKGVDIEKVTKYYSQGIETYYRIKGVDQKFWRLKDAKQYIDQRGQAAEQPPTE